MSNKAVPAKVIMHYEGVNDKMGIVGEVLDMKAGQTAVIRVGDQKYGLDATERQAFACGMLATMAMYGYDYEKEMGG